MSGHPERSEGSLASDQRLAGLAAALVLAMAAPACAERPACDTNHVLLLPPARAVDVRGFVTTQGAPAPAATAASVRWDDAGLTVSFACDDAAVTASNRARDSADLWRDDGVELFVDPGHTHDFGRRWFHIVLSAAGAIYDERGPGVRYPSGDPKVGDLSYTASGVRRTVQRTAGGWRAELEVPWSAIGERPAAGDVWGFNLARTDQPGDAFLCWSPTHGPFLDIDQWGHIAFADESGDAGDARAMMAVRHAPIQARAAERARMAEFLRRMRAGQPERAAAGSGPFVLGAWAGPRFDLASFEADRTCADNWADAALNVAMAPYSSLAPDQVRRIRKMLDRAQARGVRLILGVGGLYAGDLASRGETRYRQSMADALRQYGRHPALFGFYVGDEPGEERMPVMARAVAIQQEMAPHLHAFVNHQPLLAQDPDRWADAIGRLIRDGGTRFLCYDCYEPFWDGRPDEENRDIYFRNLLFYQAVAARAGVPLWSSGLSAAFSLYRPMTEDDFRWQLGTAVAHGASGFMYFVFHSYDSRENYRSAPVMFDERTEQFTYMRRVHDRFAVEMAPVVSRLRLRDVRHYGRAYGGAPLFDGSGLVSRVWAATPLIISEFRHENGNDYVMVVNNDPRRSTQAAIRFRGPGAEVFEPYRLNRTVTERNVFQMHYECWEPKRLPDGGVELTPNGLAPGQMLLYRVARAGDGKGEADR